MFNYITAIVLVYVTLCGSLPSLLANEVVSYQESVLPILTEHCFGCHGDGANEGGVTLDSFADSDSAVADRDLWHRAFKQLRGGLMPPADEERLSQESLSQLDSWIKQSVFQIDESNPDPGKMTLRRLNRVEYRNTIRELMGVDFDTSTEFPADDTGHGFDNLGEVLSMSPLMLEKYIAAAKVVVDSAVPKTSHIVAEKRLKSDSFRDKTGDRDEPVGDANALTLSYYEQKTVEASVPVEHAGEYQLVIDIRANERFVDGRFDLNECRLTVRIDSEVVLEQQFTRQGGRPYQFTVPCNWSAGEHTVTFEVVPLTEEEQVRSLTLRIGKLTLRGPMEEQHWVLPKRYADFFPEQPPTDEDERRNYARDLLAKFATQAFRRPVDDATLDRLVGLAESTTNQEGSTFEAGIAKAMTVILASPSFLFREEGVAPSTPSEDKYPLIDEYSLATRLSYFLWSSMPDDTLSDLADRGQLRENLDEQIDRMLADDRSSQLIRNFVGQWLQSRAIEGVNVNAFAVLSREGAPDPEAANRRRRFRELRRKDNRTEEEDVELAEVREAFFAAFRKFQQFNLDGELRRAMRRETEMSFEHLLREDRSLLELLDADYTFLNERLARHYKIEGVEGRHMRLVNLPPESPRGGVLTQGTMLAVTSNPDRTSPVKRGVFLLDNILGVPPAPPPPDIPALEEAVEPEEMRAMTLREVLALHREDALCASCHNRMDPLGLALENFNALGIWRDTERGQTIDAEGVLITGEKFVDIKELKQILVTERPHDFYRCVTEKMLTYALGRGLDYYDVSEVDRIVARLVETNGQPSELIRGIIESVPFQKRRLVEN